MSDGGTAAAATEMWLAGPSELSLGLDLEDVPASQLVPLLFGEDPAVALIALSPADVPQLEATLEAQGVPGRAMGVVGPSGAQLTCRTRGGVVSWLRADMEAAWQRLDPLATQSCEGT